MGKISESVQITALIVILILGIFVSSQVYFYNETKVVWQNNKHLEQCRFPSGITIWVKDCANLLNQNKSNNEKTG